MADIDADDLAAEGSVSDHIGLIELLILPTQGEVDPKPSARTIAAMQACVKSLGAVCCCPAAPLC